MKQIFPEEINLDGIRFKIKRSGRKTVGIRASKDGEGEILAPFGVSLSRLGKIARPYTDKIKSECEKIASRNAARDRFSLDYGDCLRLLGRSVEIYSSDNDNEGFYGDRLYLSAGLSSEGLRQEIIKAYKEFAKGYIPMRVTIISEMMGLSPKSVKINSAATHWGSCGRGGRLNFSWLSVMAKSEALDYVVIHELSHIRHFNHSPAFYKEIERYCPEYKEHISYLKKLWREISSEYWLKK